MVNFLLLLLHFISLQPRQLTTILYFCTMNHTPYFTSRHPWPFSYQQHTTNANLNCSRTDSAAFFAVCAHVRNITVIAIASAFPIRTIPVTVLAATTTSWSVKLEHQSVHCCIVAQSLPIFEPNLCKFDVFVTNIDKRFHPMPPNTSVHVHLMMFMGCLMST